MAIRSDLLARYIVIGWFLNAAFVGCGGQAGSGSSGDTTTDVTAPTITAKFPTDTQTSVPINTVIAITFSEAINANRISLVDAEITLSQAISGTIQEVQKSSEWVSASNTLFIRPTTLLEADRHYTVQITNNIVDLAGNRLDVGNSDGVLVWRFTTGTIFDSEKPIWAPNKVVQAVADRYDTMTVCWWNVENSQTQTVTGCPSAVDTFPPAAYDPPTNESSELIYTVQYKRAVDANFTSLPVPQTGAHRMTVSGLVANTPYEIQVRVSDLAANQSDDVVAATPNPVTTPPAGRLYAANHVADSLSAFSDAGQAQGNKNAAIVTADKTQLAVPTGIAVDPVGGFVYVANTNANMIAAYKLQPTVNNQTIELGQYGIGHNVAPAWTIRGTFESTDITGLCGPSTLRFERASGRSYLYVTNSFAAGTRYPPGRCLPDSLLVFDVSQEPQSSNQQPFAVIRNSRLWAPLALAVDEPNGLVYVANRDHLDPSAGVISNAGGTIDVFSFTRNSEGIIQLDTAPHRSFWGSVGGACTASDAIQNRVCGPSAAVYDSGTHSLIVVNRGKNNLLVFSDVSNPLTVGQQFPTVVAGSNTGLDNARPVGIFLDPQPFDADPTDSTVPGPRVYVTTDIEQSVLIFDRDELIVGDNVTPRRVIKGSRTMLGQHALPVPGASCSAPPKSSGPFAIAVVQNDSLGRDEAYVVTPGSFDSCLGLTPIPNLAVFDVSVSQDSSPRNTPPDRLLVNPLLGATGMALDLDNQRLYVASFHANMIVVYDNPEDFVTGLREPNRIIAGPRTMLDHPVALLFRRLAQDDPGSLYVVNQSSHSVAVFNEGDGSQASPFLAGDVAPNRYLGAPEPTMDTVLTYPFDPANATQMVFPSGLAIDPDHDFLYVSNRDAKEFQDTAGRRIVAFRNARAIGQIPETGIDEGNDVAPDWKIEGDDPPPRPCPVTGCLPVTDRTTLKRPTGLFLVRAADTPDGVDRLVVANRENSTVLIFRGVSQLVEQALTTPPDDNLAPTWTLTNASLSDPFGLAFNAMTKDLYVSDIASRIWAFNLSSLSVDTPVPSLQPRVIQGSATGLLAPHGLALDPQN